MWTREGAGGQTSYRLSQFPLQLLSIMHGFNRKLVQMFATCITLIVIPS
jgi:hypothetical protein